MEKLRKEKDPETVLLLKILIAILTAIALITAFCYYWQREYEKPLHRRIGDTAVITTDYYSLQVPDRWTECLTASVTVGKELSKFDSGFVPESLYKGSRAVNLEYKAQSGTYPIASLDTFTFPNSCTRMENWRYLGRLRFERQSLHNTIRDVYLILFYSDCPGELTEREKAEWDGILSYFAEELTYDSVSHGRNNSDVAFYPNTTGDEHGNIKTWGQMRNEERMSELAEKREQTKAEMKKQEEAQKEAESQRAAASVCKYPGCRNYSAIAGYCHKHYNQTHNTRDDFYDDDFDSYYEDNKDLYDSRAEAYEAWEEEYRE